MCRLRDPALKSSPVCKIESNKCHATKPWQRQPTLPCYEAMAASCGNHRFYAGGKQYRSRAGAQIGDNQIWQSAGKEEFMHSNRRCRATKPWQRRVETIVFMVAASNIEAARGRKSETTGLGAGIRRLVGALEYEKPTSPERGGISSITAVLDSSRRPLSFGAPRSAGDHREGQNQRFPRTATVLARVSN